MKKFQKKKKKIDLIHRRLLLKGKELTSEHRTLLLKIADRCPVHNTLESDHVRIKTSLNDDDNDDHENMVTLLATFQARSSELSPGFQVQRVLPYRKQRSVGSFIFLDHFGPLDFDPTNGPFLNVGPHPHIGLCTLTYLYKGKLLHRDSTGAQALIEPGGVNFMIAGKGVVHSERGKPGDLAQATDTLPNQCHGIQLWLALPASSQFIDPTFYSTRSIPMAKFPQCTLIIGTFNEYTQSDIPLLPQMGSLFLIDIDLTTKNITLPLQKIPQQPLIEIGIFVVSGSVRISFINNNKEHHQTTMNQGVTAVFNYSFHADDATNGFISFQSLEENTRIAFFGGTPLPEPRIMRWNFVAVDKADIDSAAQAWTNLDRSRFPPVVNEANDDSIPLP